MGALRHSRHEQFCQHLALGESQERAYLAAGYSVRGARQNAAKLARQAAIRDRLAELLEERDAVRRATVEKSMTELGLTKTWIAERLIAIVNMCVPAETLPTSSANAPGIRKPGNLTAAIRAIELLGKEYFGMFLERRADAGEGIEAWLRKLAEEESEHMQTAHPHLPPIPPTI
ncbi:MAG: hypothetical protein U1F15_15420 [Burkholderiales bacterium]